MTSKLESYLSKELYTRFGEISIRQNYRPDWMEGLELDFYIQELKLAAEVQGAQHYSFVEYFHRNEDNFEKQKERDARKRIICKEHGVRLIEIFTEKDADLFISIVTEKINKPQIQYPNQIREQKNNNKVLRGMIKAYNKASRNLWLHENGIIIASEGKVKGWESIVSKGVKIKGVRRW